jgi:hypothetical protein
LRAGAQAGFRRFELFVADFERYIELYQRENGLSKDQDSRIEATKHLAHLARELNVSFNCLQPLRDVEGIIDPKKRVEKFDEVLSYFPLCNILDIDLVLCCSSNDPTSSPSVSVISRDLVELADKAADWHRRHGGPLIRIGYEGWASPFVPHVTTS